jgi:carbon starvation protein
MLNFLNASLHNGMILMIAVLLVLAIAYRYYSAFIAAKVLALDPNRPTPAHTLHDGQNYHPTNKWVLFGHHFAAISGAGPLIGPVLAVQFGYMPGLLWILIGVCLAGAVQDFVVLGLSTRRGGKSLAQIAYLEIGTVAGTAATIGILFVLVIALAGLGKVVVQALGGETVAYPAGTQFVAPPNGSILPDMPSDNVSRYRIPVGTKIIYPNGATTEVGQRFTLESKPLHDAAIVDIDVKDPKKLPGSLLLVPPDNLTTRAIRGSSWGTFTIALTIPIAMLIGIYMTRIRKGKVLEASIIGGLLTLGAVWLGGQVDNPESFMNAFQEYFNLSTSQVAITMAIYGFIAAVLPVSILLCPRDYLSSFLKIGTVALLVLGVLLAQPTLQAPALNHAFLYGGPTVKGSIFPFLFIIIMCGAVSGFHALVSSGTTPKILDNEKDARTIGYGAMLIEGLVGIVALVAAASIPSAHYYYMNTSYKDLPAYQQQIVELSHNDKLGPGEKEVQPLSAIESRVGENLEGRTGGAVTLAVGMAKVFDDAAKRILGTASKGVAWLETMMPYWYHFAIMFEALFILTTIDAGTRVGRFLLQETMGKWIHPSLGKTASWPSTLLSTALVVGGWYYFIDSKSMEAIWPMFGISNQMLAVMALCIATVAIVRAGKARYAWVTLAPMFFVTITTMSAASVMLKNYYHQITTAAPPAARINPLVSALLILAIVACTAVILIAAFLRTRGTVPPSPIAQEPAPLQKEAPSLG